MAVFKRDRRQISVFPVALAVSALCVNQVRADVYYVRATGSDEADGKTPATAFRTVGRAAQALVNAGDRVIVGPGQYDEGNITPNRSGIAGRPVEFLADGSGAATGDIPGEVMLAPPSGTTTGFNLLSRTHLVLDGFTIAGAADAGVQAGAVAGKDSSSDLTIRNLIVRDSAKRGIDIVAAGNVVVENCTIEQSGSTGVAVAGCLSASSRCGGAGAGGAVVPRIQGNTIVASGAAGVFVAEAQGATVRENLITGSAGAGVLIRSSTGVEIASNDLDDNQEGGVSVGTGGVGFEGRNVTITNNRIENSVLSAGVSVVAGGYQQIDGNTVLRSGSGGMSLVFPEASGELALSNNTVGIGNGQGIFIRGATGRIAQNNVVFSHGAAGITLRGSKGVSLVNNLIYANGEDGIAVGTGTVPDPSKDTVILNNTLYGNAAWGVRVEQGSSGSQLLNNIIAKNRAGGIAASGTAACNYRAGFNIFFGNTPADYGNGTRWNGYDRSVDPLFVDPSGADGELGGEGFADDDFRLRQVYGGDAIRNPAVDTGFAPAADIGLTGSTATRGAPDSGLADVGYHYGASPDQTIAPPLPFMPLFVRISGSDANDGLTPARALATIGAAATRAVAGVTVVVGPGRYAEGDIHPRNSSGPVTFFGDSTGTMTGDVPGAVVIDAGKAAGCNGSCVAKDNGFVIVNPCGVVTVDGFHVTRSTTAGIQVRAGADGARIRNNVVFSNERRGIEILGAASGEISNNLVYANGTGGVRVSNGANSSVTNNTIYRNAGVGVLVGGADPTGAAPGTSVLRNVVAENAEGIQVFSNSLEGYESGFNVVWGTQPFSGGTPRAASDFIAEPQFVNPAGVDRGLGGDGFSDDNFRLQQGQDGFSPAVDIDPGSPAALLAGSTRSDGLPDLGPADAGYHYRFLPPAPVAREIDGVTFVRQDGDDALSGVGADTAVATIERALALQSGTRLIVIGPGTYHESNLRIGVRKSGISFPMLFGDTTGSLTGDRPGAVVIDADQKGGVVLLGPAILDSLTVRGAGTVGVRVLRSARGTTIRNSTICGNGRGGLWTHADGVGITNNRITGNRGRGISLLMRRPQGSVSVLNNTVAENSGVGISARELTPETSRLLLYNNIVAGNGGAGFAVRISRHRAAAAGHNLNTGAYLWPTVPGEGDIVADPAFSGGAAIPAIGCSQEERFTLAPGSPAIDAGSGTADEMGVGLWLAARAAPDSGAADLGYHQRPSPVQAAASLGGT